MCIWRILQSSVLKQEAAHCLLNICKHKSYIITNSLYVTTKKFILLTSDYSTVLWQCIWYKKKTEHYSSISYNILQLEYIADVADHFLIARCNQTSLQYKTYTMYLIQWVHNSLPWLNVWLDVKSQETDFCMSTQSYLVRSCLPTSKGVLRDSTNSSTPGEPEHLVIGTIFG